MTKVGVIRGGRSLERDFSLRSGNHIAGALGALGHEVEELDVDERLTARLQQVDVAFIALHGRDGEDGGVQSVCEALRIPFTGSDPTTCQICFDKPLSKWRLGEAGVNTPRGFSISAEAVRSMGAGPALRSAAERLGPRVIVKPAQQGSALGLSLVEDPADLPSAVMHAFNYGDRILVEEFIPGREFAVSVLGSELAGLPVVELKLAGNVFDMDARPPAPTAEFVLLKDAALADELLKVAVHAAQALGVRDFGRVDIRMDGDKPVVLEVNPCPGVAESSLLPFAFEQTGQQFTGFVETVLACALSRG